MSGIPDLAQGSNLIPIYGFGQIGGDLINSPPRPTGFNYNDVTANASGSQYNADLLLGTGTYTGSRPTIDFTSQSTQASLYDDCSGLETIQVPVTTRYIDLIVGSPFQTQASLFSNAVVPCAAVPEPASISLLLSASLPLFFRTGRRLSR